MPKKQDKNKSGSRISGSGLKEKVSSPYLSSEENRDDDSRAFLRRAPMPILRPNLLENSRALEDVTIAVKKAREQALELAAALSNQLSNEDGIYKETRTDVVKFRASSSERRLIQEAADLNGMSESQYARQCILGQANQDVTEKRKVTLTKKQFDEFMNFLSINKEPNTRLKRLVRDDPDE